MKIIKGAFQLLIAWAVILMLLFGTTIINYISSASREVQDLSDLNQYSGYHVKKLKTDWFGNWVVAKKGQEEVVFKCNDSIFTQLSVKKSIGK